MKKWDITPAGFVVVVSLGLLALWFGFVTGWLYLHGKTNDAKDSAIALGGITTPLAALLARTKNDPAPAGTPTDPVNVKTAEDPLKVTPADPEPGADWLVGT